MKTQLAHLDISAAIAPNLPLTHGKTPGGSSGSFALDLSALWSADSTSDADSSAASGMSVKGQQGGAQEPDPSPQGDDFALPLLNDDMGVRRDQLRDAPKSEALPGLNSGAGVQHGAGTALRKAPPNQSSPEVAWNFNAPGFASALVAPGISSPIAREEDGSADVAPSEGGQASPAMVPAGVEGSRLPGMDESFAATAANRSSLPQQGQDSGEIGSVASPLAQGTTQVDQHTEEDATSFIPSSLSDPAVQFDPADRRRSPSSPVPPGDDSTGAADETRTLATPAGFNELTAEFLPGQAEVPGEGLAVPGRQLNSSRTVSAWSPLAGTSSPGAIPATAAGTGALPSQNRTPLSPPPPPDPERLPRDGGQSKDGNIAHISGASGTEIRVHEAGASRDAEVATVNLSHGAQSRPFAIDGGTNPDRAGSSPSGNDRAPTSAKFSPADSASPQEVADSNFFTNATSQQAQQDSGTDSTPISPKTATLVSTGQKASSAKSDSNSNLGIDPSLTMRRSADSQNGPATSSPDSAGRITPAVQNWVSARDHLGQVMSAAHAAKGVDQLQVDLKSEDWGPVSVKASLNNGQIGAEIQVSSHDAHAALTEGLSALEKTLGDRGIQVVNLDVSHGSAYSTQSQGQQERPASQPPHDARAYTNHAIKPVLSVASTSVNTTDDYVSCRVSVRA